LNALQRLETVDRRFQQRSRFWDRAHTVQRRGKPPLSRPQPHAQGPEEVLTTVARDAQ
jgi:hypothetical protein